MGALYDQPFSLELLIDHLKGERAPNCSAWIGKMDRRGEQGWSTPMLYLAVARTGSESLNVAIGKRRAPHTHACTLPLLQREAMTTKRFGMSTEPFRVLISLRSPLERISSGVQRRSDRLNITHQKPANQLFIRHFREGADRYLNALRDVRDPLHRVAMEVTL